MNGSQKSEAIALEVSGIRDRKAAEHGRGQPTGAARQRNDTKGTKEARLFVYHTEHGHMGHPARRRSIRPRDAVSAPSRNGPRDIRKRRPKGRGTRTDTRREASGKAFALAYLARRSTGVRASWVPETQGTMRYRWKCSASGHFHWSCTLSDLPSALTGYPDSGPEAPSGPSVPIR